MMRLTGPKMTRPNGCPTRRAADGVFAPIRDVIKRLRTGYIDAARGNPVHQMPDGHHYEVVPAIQGLVLHYQRLSDAEGAGLNLEPLKKLGKRLEVSMPITEDDVNAAGAVVEECYALFLKIPLTRQRSALKSTMIKIELEDAGLV